MTRWGTTLLFLPVAVFSLAGLSQVPNAQAQLTYLDEIPWFAEADSTSRLAFVAEVDYFSDAKYEWSVNRLHVCALLPAGDRSVFFLRMSHWTFDTGGLLPIKRWPWIRGEEENFQWTSETTISSFGQFELGATGPVAIPGVKRWQYGVALGLPVGTDRLYPFSSVSLPLRLALRRLFWLKPGVLMGLTGGYLANMDSGKDLLLDNAFPDGWELGGVVNWYRGRGSRYALSYDYKNLGGHKSQLVGVQAWFSWTQDGSWGVKVARELQGTLNGPAAWYFSLKWRFDSPKGRPGSEEEPQQKGRRTQSPPRPQE